MVLVLQAQLADNEAKQKQFTEKLQHERSKLTGRQHSSLGCSCTLLYTFVY